MPRGVCSIWSSEQPPSHADHERPQSRTTWRAYSTSAAVHPKPQKHTCSEPARHNPRLGPGRRAVGLVLASIAAMPEARCAGGAHSPTSPTLRAPSNRSSRRLEPRGTRLGRNDPCWCGSGRKFKRCHQNATELPALPDRVGWLCRKATRSGSNTAPATYASSVVELVSARATGDPDVGPWDMAGARPTMPSVDLLEAAAADPTRVRHGPARRRPVRAVPS